MGDTALRQVVDDEHDVDRYEQAATYAMSIDGFLRYYRKTSPDLADWRG